MRFPDQVASAGTITDEQVASFTATFVLRKAPFLVQQRNGSYSRIDRTLNSGHVRAHLGGSITLALLPGEDSRTSFAVVDIDRASPDAVVPVWRQCDVLGLEVLTVYSGRKGFHVFAFFNEATPLAQAQDIVRLVAGTNEVWPRQRFIRQGACGNAIKAPFGVHRVTGNWCMAVNRGFEAIDDPWSILHTIRRADAAAVLAKVSASRPENAVAGAFVARDLPGQMRPCLDREWRRGTEMGKRNEVGFALAAEFRRIGLSEDEARDRLDQWNQRSRPPLSSREVGLVCRSAYAAARPYVFACSPHGALRRLVSCDRDGGCLAGSGTKHMEGTKGLYRDKDNPEQRKDKQLALWRG